MPDAPLHRLDTVVSTMDEARLLAFGGAPHGSAVVARVQLGGRGRMGRVWVSPPGNLYLTAVLRPGGSPRLAPELGFVAAVAVAEAVDRLLGPGTELKWPNDVLRGGAKLAGILLERLEDGTVLAGIGANVRHAPPDMPYPVTSLAALGCTAEPDDLLDAVLERLEAGWSDWRRAGFGCVLRRWAARGPAPGAALAIRLGETQMEGRFAGLAEDGALLLDTPGGRRSFVAGDVLPAVSLASYGSGRQ